MALLFFNVGVELGQLAFVLVVVALRRSLRGALRRLPDGAWRVPTYAIGGLAAFWVVERVTRFFSGG